jgi:hypothetical protein
MENPLLFLDARKLHGSGKGFPKTQAADEGALDRMLPSQRRHHNSSAPLAPVGRFDSAPLAPVFRFDSAPLAPADSMQPTAPSALPT